MNFVDNPMLYHHILDQEGLLDDVYKAVDAMDMSAAVLAALQVVRMTRTLPLIFKIEKSCDRSSLYRIEGNSMYTSHHYQEALECYNRALMYAPKGSTELLHAFSNRSALLYKLKAHTECLNDIETCVQLGCNGDLLKKLNKRKDGCEVLLWKDKLKSDLLTSGFPEAFFKFNVKRHPEIPCLSADVDIVCESGKRKAVTSKDIKVGSVLVLEAAYTTYSNIQKSHLSCYYCQKMSFNLMPCETCCYALFCSKTCKDSCLEEYHRTECKIMDVLESIDTGYKFRLAIKTALKVKSQCRQWNTFIQECNNIGSSRLKTSTLCQMYDVKNYSSILSFKGDRHFIFGTFYNCCFVYAVIMHHLENISGFFPTSFRESLQAKESLAKLFMNFELMWPYTTEIENTAEEVTVGRIGVDVPHHFGWFPFTGKLAHSCEPNLLVLGLDNRVALVVIHPIKKNTELKVSFIGHWYDHIYEDKRQMKLYQATLNICSCHVCKQSWGVDSLSKGNLNPVQQKVFRSWDFMRKNMTLPQREGEFFDETCKALAVFEGTSSTKEHFALFREFRTQLSLCQFAATRNCMIKQ